MKDEEEDLLKLKWKTEICHTGKGCWCRLVVPIGSSDKEDYIIPSGSVSKREAEHIVKAHNEYIKANH